MVRAMRQRSTLALLVLVACGGARETAPRPATVPASEPAPVAQAPVPHDPDEAPLPLWPEIKRGTLANGLTYYILKHQKPEKRVFLWLAVNAGSVQEDDDQRGLAHFDEHMAFNGTAHFPKADIVNYLEKIGMRFGADLNASTSWDETVYKLEVPTDDVAYVHKGFDILRDWAGGVSYDPTEIEKERGVVLEEWRLGRGAQMRLFNKQAGVLFKGARYAERIPIGLPEIIKGAPPEALTRFYRDWYRPDLMAVVVVGDFDDAAAIQAEIEQKFGDLKSPASPRPRVHGGVPIADGARISIETDHELPGATVSVSNQLPHRPNASKKDFRRFIVEDVYNRILTERLARIAREPDAPFAAAFGFVSSQTRDIDAFARFAQVKTGHSEEALRALLTEVLRIERHGVTAAELERARVKVARDFEEGATTEATTDSRDFVQEIIRNFLADEFVIGRAAEKELALALLPGVTVAELDTLAKGFGGADNRVILIAGPDEKALPARERALAIFDEVSKSDIPPWVEKAAGRELMAKLPAPGKIVLEKKLDAIGVTEWTLGNGARVVVKPTDFETDNVVVRASSPGGLALARDRDFATDRFATEVARVGGAGEFDADSLDKVLAGKQVHVITGLDDSTEQLRAEGSTKDIETLFQLVHLRLVAPRKDEQQFGVWKQNSAELWENRRRVPEVQYEIQSNDALWKGSVRRKLPDPADFAKVDLAKALAFYRDRFGDVSDFTFVIVGDVKLEQVRPLVETYLGSLPGKGRKEREKDLALRKVGGVVHKSFSVGQEPKASVRLDFHGDETWSRDKDRDLLILGRVLSIRLREILREDMGGVYGVRAGGQLSRAPHQERSFAIQFGCAPENVEPLVQAALAEVARIAKDGIGADYIEKVKAAYLRERETAMRTNSFWADWLGRSYRFGDDPTIVLDTTGILARMTSDRIKAAAGHYVDTKQYFEAVMLPAAAAKANSSTP